MEDDNGSTCLEDDNGCLEDTGWRVEEEENTEFAAIDDERGDCLNDGAFLTEDGFEGITLDGKAEEEDCEEIKREEGGGKCADWMDEDGVWLKREEWIFRSGCTFKRLFFSSSSSFIFRSFSSSSRLRVRGPFSFWVDLDYSLKENTNTTSSFLDTEDDLLIDFGLFDWLFLFIDKIGFLLITPWVFPFLEVVAMGLSLIFNPYFTSCWLVGTLVFTPE